MVLLPTLGRYGRPGPTLCRTASSADVVLAVLSLGMALLAGLSSAALPPVDELIRKGLLREDGGRTHAVLIAGSSGYDNYRHQADVCHAYQILHQHGIKDESIVTFMYDDIANSWRNPKKGRIYNEPGGPDVYAGVKKDYTGKDVTPKNFLSALQGLANEASGPVLQNTTNQDDIFVYFADHGGGGILGFPNLFGILPQSLHEADLEKTIKSIEKTANSTKNPYSQPGTPYSQLGTPYSQPVTPYSQPGTPKIYR